MPRIRWTYDAGGKALSFSTTIKVLDEAPLNMLKEFTSGPELLAFLKGTAPPVTAK